MYAGSYSVSAKLTHSSGLSKLDIPSGAVASERGFALSYSLLPGQETEVLSGLTNASGLALVKMYVVEASEPISLAISNSPTALGTFGSLGGLHLWANPTGSSMASLKLKVPATASGTVSIDLLLALD